MSTGGLLAWIPSQHARHPLATTHCACALRRSVFLNYEKVLQIPALVALHVADTARSLEALSNAEVVAEAMEVGGCALCALGALGHCMLCHSCCAKQGTLPPTAYLLADCQPPCPRQLPLLWPPAHPRKPTHHPTYPPPTRPHFTLAGSALHLPAQRYHRPRPYPVQRYALG